MININELTIGQLKELGSIMNTPAASCDGDDVWKVGSNYFIRTVTHHLTGKLLKVTQHELLLGDAAWIADDGRYNEFVSGKAEAKEIEPYPGDAIVGRGAIIDACIYPRELPRSVK